MGSAHLNTFCPQDEPRQTRFRFERDGARDLTPARQQDMPWKKTIQVSVLFLFAALGSALPQPTLALRHLGSANLGSAAELYSILGSAAGMAPSTPGQAQCILEVREWLAQQPKRPTQPKQFSKFVECMLRYAELHPAEGSKIRNRMQDMERWSLSFQKKFARERF